MYSNIDLNQLSGSELITDGVSVSEPLQIYKLETVNVSLSIVMTE